MFSGFSFIYTLFPFGGEVGVLHGASALPAGSASSKAVGSVTGTTRALANISFPCGTEGVIKNRVQRTSEQTMSRAFPSCLLLFPLNITIFVLCFFFIFLPLFKMSCKAVQEKSSFAMFLMPSPLVLMVLMISWLENGPPGRMGCKDPWDVHIGLWLTRLFLPEPFLP